MNFSAFLRRMTLVKFCFILFFLFISASLVVIGGAIWPQAMPAFIVAAVVLISVGTIALEIRFPESPSVKQPSPVDQSEEVSETIRQHRRPENWLSRVRPIPRARPEEGRRADHSAELEREVDRLRQIADASRSGIAQANAAGTIAYANKTLLGIFDVSSVAELMSLETVFDIDGEECTGVKALLRMLAAQPEKEINIQFYAAGAKRFLRGHASALSDPGGPGEGGTIFHVTDVTESVREECRDRYYARHDSLTGAYNRVAFLQDLDDAAGKARDGHGVALLAIDLDRFKPINDSHGHAAGDMVLKTIVSRLDASVGTDGSVYRLGGDEFMVIKPLEPGQDVAETANEILSSLEQPIALSDAEVSVSASLGIAIMPEDAENARELVSLADGALYRSKEDGGGRFGFHDDAHLPREKLRERRSSTHDSYKTPKS